MRSNGPAVQTFLVPVEDLSPISANAARRAAGSLPHMKPPLLKPWLGRDTVDLPPVPSCSLPYAFLS